MNALHKARHLLLLIYVGLRPTPRLGPVPAGLGAATVTPVAAAMPPVLTLAHSVSSILSEHFFVAPAWGYWVELLLFALVAAYLIAALPRLKAGPALLVTSLVFVAL